jgi:hypothetical protein
MASRYAFETRFRISVERQSQKCVFEGWARDISESGLGAFVGQSLELGERATLTVPVAGGESLLLEGEVVRCRGTEYGFEFITLSSDQRSLIRSLVEGRAVLPN